MAARNSSNWQQLRLRLELLPSRFTFRGHFAGIRHLGYYVVMAAQWMASFPARCFQIAWPHPDGGFRKTSVGGFELRS
jgi:hypothetical protein